MEGTVSNGPNNTFSKFLDAKTVFGYLNDILVNLGLRTGQHLKKMAEFYTTSADIKGKVKREAVNGVTAAAASSFHRSTT